MKDKKSILLVEDEASLSMIIKDALEEEDFQVITAGNGLAGDRSFLQVCSRPDYRGCHDAGNRRVRNDPADTEGE